MKCGSIAFHSSRLPSQIMIIILSVLEFFHEMWFYCFPFFMSTFMKCGYNDDILQRTFCAGMIENLDIVKF
jgi:hypothetical protein